MPNSPWRHDAGGLRFHIEVPIQYQGAHRHHYLAGYMRGWLKKRNQKPAPPQSKTPEQEADEKLWTWFLEAHPQFKGHHYSEPDPGARVYPYYEAWLHNLIKGLKPEDARRPGEGKAAYRIRTGIH